MGDHKSTRKTNMYADLARRMLAALSARALWAAVLYLLHHDM